MAKSLFQAGDHIAFYAKHRPTWPKKCAAKIVDILQEKFSGALQLCLDVGCGSGQSSSPLAEHFQTVVGIDVSEEQIKQANERIPDNLTGKLRYRVGSAEDFEFITDASCQLVTSFQAAHWFDLKKFYTECDRILESGGLVVNCCYALPRFHDIISRPVADRKPMERFRLLDDLNEAMDSFYLKTKELEGWPVAGRYHIDTRYYELDVAYPVHTTRVDSMAMFKCTTASAFIGYLNSWSSIQLISSEKGRDVADQLLDTLKQRVETICETKDPEFVIRHDISMVLSRKP